MKPHPLIPPPNWPPRNRSRQIIEALDEAHLKLPPGVRIEKDDPAFGGKVVRDDKGMIARAWKQGGQYRLAWNRDRYDVAKGGYHAPVSIDAKRGGITLLDFIDIYILAQVRDDKGIKQ